MVEHRLASLWGLTVIILIISQATLPVAAQAVSTGAEPQGNGPASQTIRTRGIVKAAERAVLSSPLSNRIEKIPFKPGMAFEKGNSLVVFDCRRENAHKQGAFSAYKARKNKAAKDSELVAFNAAGALDAEISSAERDQALADFQAATARAQDCEIVAPYGGRVVSRPVALYETPQAGDPILEIVSTERYEISLIAPADWLAWLEPGQPFRFIAEHGAGDYEASIARIGAVVDPVSQTIDVIGEISSVNSRLRAGLAGTAIFSKPGE